MDLTELHKPQEELDNYIEEKRNLQHKDLTKKKTVAAICELYECANEARFFKFWSDDQKARTAGNCKHCFHGTVHMYGGEGQVFSEKCEHCKGTGMVNPLLEEYVDTVHFVISLANDHGYTDHVYADPGDMDLNDLVLGLTHLLSVVPYVEKNNRINHLGMIFDYLIKFGYQLGFDEKQVIAAYHDKNKINHQRQDSGY